MQFLAILDAEEFVFLDDEHKYWIGLAWADLGRRDVAGPADEDETVYHRPDAVAIMPRLQTELPRAL
jgi:hypothetical protein